MHDLVYRARGIPGNEHGLDAPAQNLLDRLHDVRTQLAVAQVEIRYQQLDVAMLPSPFHGLTQACTDRNIITLDPQ